MLSRGRFPRGDLYSNISYTLERVTIIFTPFNNQGGIILSKPNRYRIAAVDRAIDVLNAVANRPGASVAELAIDLKANRSLVFRMLSTLADRGCVIKDANTGYRLGPQLLYLGQHAAASDALVNVSADILDQLCERTRQTVLLAVRDDMEMICVAERRSLQPVQIAPGTGTRGGLHTGGAAKTLLAYAPQEVQESVLGRNLGEFVPATLRTRRAVLEVLKRIRHDGYYEAIDEIAAGVSSISAPIFDATGNVVAVVVIIGPTERMMAGKRRQSRDLTLAAAAEISARINWQGR
jgi:DNA-binding IclR family transcriptional regulator